jgi:hypothetical protein
MDYFTIIKMYINSMDYFRIIKMSKFEFDPNMLSMNILNNNKHSIQTGIGDILYTGLLAKNNIISTPIYINVGTYLNNAYLLNNPFQNFIFIVNLLTLLYDKDEVIFFNDACIMYSNWENKLYEINDAVVFQKKINFNNLFSEEYIVFHTKCRFLSNFNYAELKENIHNFCKNFKTKYKIIIWGEKIMPSNYETNSHNITTIYEELKQLNNNNRVVDLSQENIYDNMDINNYLTLLNVYNKSKVNIFCGISGGNLASCICFGKKSFAFVGRMVEVFDYVLNNEKICKNVDIFDNYNTFFSSIENICN